MEVMKTILIVCKDRHSLRASFQLEVPKYQGEGGGMINGGITIRSAHIQTTTARIDWMIEDDFYEDYMKGKVFSKVIVEPGVSVDPMLVMIVENGPMRVAKIEAPK
jgi:hypothetical protein